MQNPCFAALQCDSHAGGVSLQVSLDHAHVTISRVYIGRRFVGSGFIIYIYIGVTRVSL